MKEKGVSSIVVITIVITVAVAGVGSYFIIKRGWGPASGSALPSQVPLINIDPTEAQVGADVTIQGKGFAVGTLVYIYFDGESRAAAVTDNAGTFSAYFQVFLRGGGPTGDHYVEVAYVEGYDPKDIIASAKFTILKSTYGELALLHVSTTYDIPIERLILTSEQERELPMIKLKYWRTHVIDPVTREDYYVCFDEKGNIVSERELIDLEREATLKKYGKLSVDLYEFLENLGSEERVKVGIWLTGAAEPIIDFLRVQGFDVTYISRYAPLIFAELPKWIILELQKREDAAGIYRSITYTEDYIKTA